MFEVLNCMQSSNVGLALPLPVLHEFPSPHSASVSLSLRLLVSSPCVLRAGGILRAVEPGVPKSE